MHNIIVTAQRPVGYADHSRNRNFAYLERKAPPSPYIVTVLTC